MNESSQPQIPQIPQALIRPILPPRRGAEVRSGWHWFKQFLAYNPFYLLSAALLLYGVYRISVEPGFLRHETGQLIFNFSSLQIYEVLVIITAIFLARRRIWYDSTLLVGLENLLLLVPFILVSQAALIDRGMVWAMCLAGGLLAVGRIETLKRCIRELNFPPRLAAAGLGVLLVNVLLPIVYRHFHETKVGTRPDWGAAYFMNEWAWLLVLPCLCALANLLPPMCRTGNLAPQRAWLPMGLFALWLTGTAVHIYSLGYVYDFNLRRELTAPAIWVLLWTGFRRAADLERDLAWRRFYLASPLVATLLGIAEAGPGVFLALTALNVVIYGYICVRHCREPFPLHLFFISLAAMIGAWPLTWVQALVHTVTRAHLLGASVAIYCLIWAALSRNPKVGLLGTLAAAGAVVVLGGGSPTSIHWALQTGAAFLLLHSLRWDDDAHEGAALIRGIVGLFWISHALVWTHGGAALWMPAAVAAPVGLGYLAMRVLGQATSWVIPLAAGLVTISGPVDFAVVWLLTAPAGLLAMAGSLALFGLGTLGALNKHRGHRDGPANQPDES